MKMFVVTDGAACVSPAGGNCGVQSEAPSGSRPDPATRLHEQTAVFACENGPTSPG